MYRPPDEPDNYFTLKARILKRVQADQADEIARLLQGSFKQALHAENIVLSRAEHERLFKLVLKELFAEILKRP